MLKRLLLLLVIACTLSHAQSITWTEITTRYALPSGIKVFKGERTAPALAAYYIDVDLNNPKLMLLPYLSTASGGKETIVPFVARTGAIAGVNGGFFGGSASYSTVIVPEGVLAQNVPSVTRTGGVFPMMRSMYSIDKNKKQSVNWIYHFGSAAGDVYSFAQPMPYVNNDPTPRPAPVKTQGTPMNGILAGIGGGPTLVKAGQPRVTFNEEVLWGSGVATDINSPADPRTAVGSTAANHAILLAADGRGASLGLTLAELAQVMIDLGCTEAMNLDGGGSTQMAVGGTLVNTPSESRAVPTMLAVVYADSLHLPKTPLFEKTYDTNAPECSLVGPGWFQSANPGYFGAEKAQLNATGTGGSYAKFSLSLPRAGVYEVYGWWVNSSNRSTETPFIVTHRNGTDTVRADQTQKGSAWNLIGTYTFRGDTTDAVVISNAVKNPNSNLYIVADGLRVVSYDPAVTAVERSATMEPSAYALSQNYPNPFNPSTEFRYTVAASGRTTLKIYDMLGRIAAVLVDATLAPGTYTAGWNASQMPSGVYLLRMTSGSFTETKKLIVQK
ncbi:MAG: phosphodiester glycosidase family protein [Acidobacteriota bacterium]